MPRGLETYTECAGPGVARSHEDLGGVAGFVANAWMTSPAATITGTLAFLAAMFAFVPFGLCISAGIIIVGLAEFKHWYYNERLLCIRDDECAIGTVISDPGPPYFDGDVKLNLLLAPFTQAQVVGTLVDHLDRNRDMLENDANFSAPFHDSGAPTLPSRDQLLGDIGKLQDYMADLEGDDPSNPDRSSEMYNQVVVGVVDTLLQQTDEEGRPKSFFERFFRKVQGAIPDTATWDAIPTDFDDSVDWQASGARSDDDLNPMFRYDNGHAVPFLHCEIEGNYVEVFVNDLLTAMSAFLVGCVLGGGGPVGAAVGAALAVLAYLVKKLVDWITGNDGDAAEPDVEWDDEDFTGYGDVTERSGDVAVVYGDWIMDTEHQAYFEVHPVRAYYIIAESALSEEGTPVPVSDQEAQVPVGPNYDPTQVHADEAADVCGVVAEAEERAPDSTVPVTRKDALSYGAETRY